MEIDRYMTLENELLLLIAIVKNPISSEGMNRDYYDTRIRETVKAMREEHQALETIINKYES